MKTQQALLFDTAAVLGYTEIRILHSPVLTMKKNKDKQRLDLIAGKPGKKIIRMPESCGRAVLFDRLVRSDWLVAALVCAGFLSTYAMTLCPTFFVGDSAEFSAIAACWGVAHPPGYPLYCLLSALFVRLVPVGEIAWRTNLFSAVCGSLAVGLLFLLCRRIGASRPAGIASAVCFGTGAAFWSQAIVAEVYCIDVVLIFLALFFVFRLQDLPTRRNYFLCGLIAGLMIGHRLVNLFYFVPMILSFMAAGRKRSVQPPSVFLYALIGMAVSGAVFLYLPVASSFNPPIDAGDPETLGRFWDVVTAKSYQELFGVSSFLREIKRSLGFFTMLPANLGVAALAAPFGFWLLIRRGKWLLAGGLAYAAVCCIGFSAKYTIADISIYFLPALAMLALAASCGFDLLPRRFVWAAVLLCFVNLPLQYRSHDYSSARLGELYARDILKLAPPGAIIFTRGDTASNILIYLQSIQGVRPDVSIVLAFDYPPADWYAALQKRKYPQVHWPSQGSDYYLQERRIRTGESWLKTLITNNIQTRSVCMVDQPEIMLRDLKLAEFLPYWHKVPDGVLYCLDSPGQTFSLEQRIDGTKVFWGQHAGRQWRTEDGADTELDRVAFNYLKARFFFAEALASSDQIDAAVEQLRILAALNPDQLEEKIHGAYHTTGMFRLGERAQKALAAQPAH